MTFQAKARRAGGATVPFEVSSARTDAETNSLSRLRLQRLVGRLHALGPSPLFHFLNEIEGGADIRERLEIYAALDREFIKVLGGDQFPLALRAIDGDRR